MSRIATPPLSQSAGNSSLKLAYEKIALRAYEKWIKRGRPQGTEMQDWIEAENELKMEMTRTTPQLRR